MLYNRAIRKLAIVLGVVTIVFACIYAGNAQASAVAPNIQTFYHQPSYNKFISDIKAINLPGSDIVLMFSTMVVDAHPQYAQEITQNFPKYSPEDQQLLFLALVATNRQTEVDNIIKNYHYKNTSQPMLTAQQIKEVKIKDIPAMLDITWIAYFATGDDKYLLKIIKYINENPSLLPMSNELVNNQYGCGYIKGATLSRCNQYSNGMIAQIIKEKYPQNTREMLNKAAVVASALWALQSNSQQDSLVAVKIKNILATHT